MQFRIAGNYEGITGKCFLILFLFWSVTGKHLLKTGMHQLLALPI